MKKIVQLACAILIIGNCLTANAQTQEEMKAWTDYKTPGDVHKMIAKWNGKWNGEVSMWMQPGAPPAKSTSTCVNKMILGGRYQESRHTGNMMGMPFEGISTLGWDNARKILVSTWVDNMGTGIMYLEGAWDDATKSAAFKGKSTDPITKTEIDIREVFTIIDDNTQKMEMYCTQNGQEFKTMEIKFTRSK